MSVLRQSLTVTNFAQMSKQIENNKIQANLVEFTMKRQIDRNRQIYAYPATVGKAKLHSQATKFNFKPNLNDKIPVVCPCCMYRVDGEEIEICYGTTQKKVEHESNYEEFKLTTGVALFFSFLKSAIAYVLLTLLFFGYTIYLVIQSAFEPCPAGSTCQSPIEKLFISEQTNFTISDILLIGLIVSSMIFFFVYRKWQYELNKFVGEKSLSEDQYTILVSNISLIDFPKPKEQNASNTSQFLYRKHLEQFLEQKIKDWVEKTSTNPADEGTNEGDLKQILLKNQGELKSNEIVKSISLCYNLQRLQILDKTKQDLIQQQEGAEDESNSLIEEDVTDRFSTIPKKVDFINDCSVVLSKQFATDNSFLFNLTHFVGSAFVSFQFQHYKVFFLEESQRNPQDFVYNGQQLKIVSAANPNEIIWKNFKSSNSDKNKLKANAWLLLLLILVISLALNVGLNYGLYNKTLGNQLNIHFLSNPYIAIIVTSVYLMVSNAVIRHYSRKLIEYEQHKTKINETTSYISKVVICQFINSALFLYILSIIRPTDQILIPSANGFILITSILEIVLNLIFPRAVWKKIKLWYKYRNLTNEDRVNNFQRNLNKEYQLAEFNIANKYSYYISKVYFCFFYCYLCPLGIALTFLTILIQFWIDKMNLFRRASLLYSANLAVAKFSLKLLQFSVFIYAFGYLYFSDLTRSDPTFNVLTFVALALATIYAILILCFPAKLDRKIFGKYESSDQFIYDDCLSDGKFSETYWTQNPASFLVDESNITGKSKVTNPALLRQFGKETHLNEMRN